MKYFLTILLLLGVAAVLWWYADSVEAPATTEVEPQSEVADSTVTLDPAIQAHIEAKSGLITVNEPQPNATVASPLTITGQARGTWFFEGSFPVILTDWDGRIIAEHYATAQGEWMTEEFIPFTSTIEFDTPYVEGDPAFERRGTLILQRSNPSGLPENDDALEFPVFYGEPGEENAAAQYQEAINSAEAAAEALTY